MPRAGDWRGPGGDKWLDYHKIVSVIQASLEQNLTDGEIRKFFGVHPLVDLTAAKRRRLARLKARQVLSALRSAIIAGLVEDPDKGVNINGFMRIRSRRNIGYGAIKPRGILYASEGGGYIMQRSALLERRYEMVVAPDTFRGDFPPLGLIDAERAKKVNYVTYQNLNEPGIFVYRTWQKLAVKDEIDGKVRWINWDYIVDFAFLGVEVKNPNAPGHLFYLLDKNPVLTDYGIEPLGAPMTIDQYEKWAKAMPAAKDAWGIVGNDGRLSWGGGYAHADNYAKCFPQKRWFYKASGWYEAVNWIDAWKWWELNESRIDKLREWGSFIPPDPRKYPGRRTGYVTVKFEPGILPET